MSEASTAERPVLSPWLQGQLTTLLARRGHAWLLQGPSGLGQYTLGLELARAWLCEHPTPHGACYQCRSCHAIDVRTHADLCTLMPETLALELNWPLDEKTQKDLDDKKRKPSKEIRVEAARDMVSFSQQTRSGGSTKVVFVYPAERMNHVTANTILKTRSAGAIPKEMISAKESNSLPKALSCPPSRATRPSSISNMKAPKIQSRLVSYG